MPIPYQSSGPLGAVALDWRRIHFVWVTVHGEISTPIRSVGLTGRARRRVSLRTDRIVGGACITSSSSSSTVHAARDDALTPSPPPLPLRVVKGCAPPLCFHH